MALTQGLNHEFIAEAFSAETLQEQARIGNITQDDADLASSLKTEFGETAFEMSGRIFNEFSLAMETTVIDRLDEITGDAIGLPFGIEDKIKGWIEDALGPILDIVRRIPDQVTNALDVASDALTESLTGITSKVLSNVGTIAGVVSDLADNIESRVVDPVIDALDAAQTIFSEIDDKVRNVVNLAVAPLTATANTLLDKVQGFATALRETIPELGDALVSGLTAPMELTGNLIGDAVTGMLDTFFKGIAPDVVGRIDPFITMLEEELSVAPELRKLTAPGALPLLAIGGVIGLMAATQAVGGVVSAALSPFGEKLRQRMNALARPALVGATDAIQAQQRGFMEESLANLILERHGLPGDQQQALTDLVKLRPGTLDIIDFWRREIFDDGQAETELHNLGWNQRYIAILKEAAFPPPGVQDLIRMAVREVFSPEIAKAFGQFEGAPDEYLAWAKKIGLSEHWAMNYWAAHWVLPSVQQGFEMLHRGVIDGTELERLFVALDVMPFWRSNLKAISFRPYTRVDVRRMFALGVLDQEGVLRAYLDLGFDDEKAINMTTFTVRWVESTRKVEKDKERDLTKGDIIGLFNDGLLSESQAKSHLESMGFDRNESELLVSREIMQEMRQDRKAEIKLIVDQAKIKVLTFNEAQDKLNGLDLTRKEMERALIEVTRATTERVRLPSKSDLDNWKELDLISLEQYGQELDNMGFPAKYVALYTEAIQLEEAEDLLAAEIREARKAEPRPVTKSQLDNLFRTDVIDATGYVDGLERLRFAPGTVDTFLAQITVQIEEREIADAERLARGEEAAERERLLSRVVLGKLLLKGLIDFDAYALGLEKLGFGVESVNLLVNLMRQKLAESLEAEG